MRHRGRRDSFTALTHSSGSSGERNTTVTSGKLTNVQILKISNIASYRLLPLSATCQRRCCSANLNVLLLELLHQVRHHPSDHAFALAILRLSGQPKRMKLWDFVCLMGSSFDGLLRQLLLDDLCSHLPGEDNNVCGGEHADATARTMESVPSSGSSGL